MELNLGAHPSAITPAELEMDLRLEREAIQFTESAKAPRVIPDLEPRSSIEWGPEAAEIPPGKVGNDGPGFELVDVDAIFAPLPPVPYLVQRLDMCPGAPTLFAGYGFSGKTLAAQSLAISVCTGRDAWGEFMIQRRGPVVHIDYEQGFRLTAERYQRLAAAQGFTGADLGGLLHLAPLPSLTLSSDAAFDALVRACDGAALLIVDSFRACAPDVDENSSDVRQVLDMLTKVSERTGVVVVVIHHARKPSANDAGGGPKMAIRGSSAIFDACASVLVFSAQKGEPIEVTHEKARTSGITAEEFTLEVRDVEIVGVARQGLEVRSAVLPPKEDRRAEADKAKRSGLDASVLAFVGRNPGVTQRGVEETDELRGRATERRGALERLMLGHAIHERPGARNARTFWLGKAGDS